ncbi:MAG: hypothetical protein JW969_20835 [Spirochaetales bacterium]|nr:hypothetical protein [Spirochaetales bacterium]
MNEIDQAAEWISQCRYLVAFTGAGISTESGLPDFRGPDGVWTRRDKGLPPPKLKKRMEDIRPNAAHRALVDLQNMGILKFLISQNVDNLHLESGIKPAIIAELHGNGKLMRCLKCGKKMSLDKAGWSRKIWGNGYRTDPVKKGQPVCPFCRGRIISSVVNFGDPLPKEDLEMSYYHSGKCDVFLAVGSSLVVSPANDMPQEAARAGARLIIINMGETPVDRLFNLIIREKIGLVLPEIVGKVKQVLKA